MTFLSVENLSVGYQTRHGLLKAVDGVSFSLEQGRSMGLVGESGCGKTTVGMALMGLLPENASTFQGRIVFEGSDLTKMSKEQIRRVRWKKISMIFQAAMNALNPVHRVNEQIAEAILTHSPQIEKKSVMKQVENLFELVGIPLDRMSDFPHQYSGGMKQRAVIAMALACSPALIVADEPTTALDVIVQDQILKAIKKIQRELKISIILISHDIGVVANVCDKISVMYAGQLVEEGSVREVFRNPMHPYTRFLLSSYITLDGEISRLKVGPGEAPDLLHAPQGCRFGVRCPDADATCIHSPPEWVEVSPTHRVLCRYR